MNNLPRSFQNIVEDSKDIYENRSNTFSAEEVRLVLSSLSNINSVGFLHGFPIGTTDRNGVPLCIGDILSFDEREWGGACIFAIGFSDGEVTVNGCYSELSTYTTLMAKWNDPNIKDIKLTN